jgi:hypothetical protein
MGQLGTTNLNLGTSNLNLGTSNLNLNLNLGANGGSGSSNGRINTQEFRKLVDREAFPFQPNEGWEDRVKTMMYREFWDPDLQSYIYLNEFVTRNTDWLPSVKGALDRTEQNLRASIGTELVAVLNAAPEREARFAEIVQQDSAAGAISYWVGMLMLDNASPATCLLISVARRIGEHAAMCLKQQFRVPRPSQLFPGIVPMIDPPVHSSFPSGHALGAHLISRCLREARPDLPQAAPLLEELANRVAENRVIAGLHYPLDSTGGEIAARECYERLAKGPAFQELLDLAKKELYGAGGAKLTKTQVERAELKDKKVVP